MGARSWKESWATLRVRNQGVEVEGKRNERTIAGAEDDIPLALQWELKGAENWVAAGR